MKPIKAVQYDEVGWIRNDDMHTSPRIVTENYFSNFAAQIHSEDSNSLKAEKLIKTHTKH